MAYCFHASGVWRWRIHVGGLPGQRKVTLGESVGNTFPIQQRQCLRHLWYDQVQGCHGKVQRFSDNDRYMFVYRYSTYVDSVRIKKEILGNTITKYNNEIN